MWTQLETAGSVESSCAFTANTWLFGSLFEVLSPSIRVWETVKRTTRQPNAQVDGNCVCVGCQFVVVGKATQLIFFYRCRNNCIPEADASQRLCGPGKAVPSSTGRLHSGISRRSDIFH